MKLYPFLLDYLPRDYIWGGDMLSRRWHKQSNMTNIAESFELSDYSRIKNGAFSGLSLKEYVQAHPEILGKKAQGIGELPILIKLIDAAQHLSIQVHPDQQYAMKVEGQRGKNEIWYICQAAKGAFIYLGLNKTLSKQQIVSAIDRGKIENYLNKIYIKTGESYYVPTGTLHAIGAGVTLLEVQQNSNITYRVFDYNRVDKDGQKRELHINKALEVMNYNKYEVLQDNRDYKNYQNYKQKQLIQNEYFTVEEYKVKNKLSLYNEDSFIAFTVIKGSGYINEYTIRKGDTVFLGAKGLGHISGAMTIIAVSL